MKIVCISDTHGQHERIDMPSGDVLIHAGDIFARGLRNSEMISFNSWLGTLDFEHILVIAGNHDQIFETNREYMEKLMTNATYLEDSSVTIEGVKFYGAPWTPNFFDWSFMPERGAEMKAKWDLIDFDTDVLITHGHAKYTLDCIQGEHVGCEELAYAVNWIKPKYCIAGHIHASHGVLYKDGINYINPAICTEAYRPDNKPIVFTYGEDVDE